MTKRMLLILAALCLVLAGCAGNRDPSPSPAALQQANPILEVESREEMEQYLDFSVPLLEKEAEKYIVLVIDGYPRLGRVCYADGGEFRIQYGSGDISGIYGGQEEKTQTIGGVQVTFLVYEEIRYALWEMNGFTCCLTGAEMLEAEVEALIG